MPIRIYIYVWKKKNGGNYQLFCLHEKRVGILFVWRNENWFIQGNFLKEQWTLKFYSNIESITRYVNKSSSRNEINECKGAEKNLHLHNQFVWAFRLKLKPSLQTGAHHRMEHIQCVLSTQTK